VLTSILEDQSGAGWLRIVTGRLSAGFAGTGRCSGDSRLRSYFLVQFADDEEPAPAALAFFASRFSFRDLLAAVFELFEPPLSLLAMVTSSRRRDRC
jgi:hypothetical protein